jgi:putative phosphoesterase
MAFDPATLTGDTIRIGLISDTHVPRDARMLPPHVAAAFEGVDLILHAGDIYVPAVLDELEEIAPVLAARGNGDWNYPEDDRVRDNQILRIGGVWLGMTHGIDYPRSNEIFLRQVEAIFHRRLDIVVVGDSHVPLAEVIEGIHFVNPGSPALHRNMYELGTVGLIEIANGGITVQLVPLDEFPIPFRPDLTCH